MNPNVLYIIMVQVVNLCYLEMVWLPHSYGMQAIYQLKDHKIFAIEPTVVCLSYHDQV